MQEQKLKLDPRKSEKSKNTKCDEHGQPSPNQHPHCRLAHVCTSESRTDGTKTRQGERGGDYNGQ